MPKTTVSTTGENPHRLRYSGYSGVGALEPAKNDTERDASRQKDSAGDRCRTEVETAGFAAEIVVYMVTSIQVDRQTGLSVVELYRPVC